MKWQIYFFLFILSYQSFAQNQMPQNVLAERFKNDREGDSLFINRLERNLISNWEERVNLQQTIEIFQSGLEHFNPSTICAFNLMAHLKAMAEQYGNPKGFLYTLRKNDLIDDIALTALLKNFSALEANISLKTDLNKEITPKQREVFEEFMDKKANNRCIDETYKAWKSKIAIAQQNTRADIIQVAYQQKIINYQSFQKLYRANLVKLDIDYVSLRDYLSKKQDLRVQKPLSTSEKANLINLKVPKTHIGYRTRLYQRYNLVQIIVLADVIKKLNEHLASPKIAMQVYDKNDVVIRSLELEEMERFRFAIKFLRKEMTSLGNNVYFSGQSPSYMDLITAAYEVDLISAKDIEEVAKLEELWNPKKTFYEKAAIWVRLAGSVGTLLIPPPYGFVVALGLVALEATAKKSEKILSPDHSLF